MNEFHHTHNSNKKNDTVINFSTENIQLRINL